MKLCHCPLVCHKSLKSYFRRPLKESYGMQRWFELNGLLQSHITYIASTFTGDFFSHCSELRVDLQAITWCAIRVPGSHPYHCSAKSLGFEFFICKGLCVIRIMALNSLAGKKMCWGHVKDCGTEGHGLVSNTGGRWMTGLGVLKRSFPFPFLFLNDSMIYKGTLTWIVNTACSRVGFTSGMRAWCCRSL